MTYFQLINLSFEGKKRKIFFIECDALLVKQRKDGKNILKLIGTSILTLNSA
ncbi:hypothetical protein LEP1GSC169_0556 [Leptospira santarosai str. HAI1349]|nr:hypothetical protein LEP1GSC169_0556 [Leptospira santarosai str. HAI1349]